MIIFFALFAWIWIAITVIGDVLRRQDIGGLAKAAWVVFVIVLPWLGMLIYLIAQHDGMRERQVKAAQAQQQLDHHVRKLRAVPLPRSPRPRSCSTGGSARPSSTGSSKGARLATSHPVEDQDSHRRVSAGEAEAPRLSVTSRRKED